MTPRRVIVASLLGYAAGLLVAQVPQALARRAYRIWVKGLPVR